MNTQDTCNNIIDLSQPVRSERIRGFQPPWRTVFIYRCPACKAESHIRANSYRGKYAVPGVGGIVCNAPIHNPQPMEVSDNG